MPDWGPRRDTRSAMVWPSPKTVTRGSSRKTGKPALDTAKPPPGLVAKTENRP